MTRRTILQSPLLLRLRHVWSNFLNVSGTTRIVHGDSLPRVAEEETRIILENTNHKLAFDPKTAQLLSLRGKIAPEQEFIVSSQSVPVFVIQYLNEVREFRRVSSLEAGKVSVESTGRKLTAIFARLGGVDLAATVSVRLDEQGPQSRWSISLRNHAKLAITDVQFPFVVAPYQLGGAPRSEAILQPLTTGSLVQAPTPLDLEPDSPHAWQFRPENFDTHHYPGLTFAQFLAYYNNRAGIYIACEDDRGSIKLIKPVHSHVGGVRLGIAHVGDWPTDGEHDLGYDVVLQTFKGDWYDAAGIYRDWSLKQRWAAVPLHKRTDVPDWLLDSPPHIIIRMQGQVDHGPTEPNRQFLPYSKLVPLLENISKQIDAPLVGVVMSWERPGPWVYPNSLPPVGGDESLQEFTELARARGWHVGSYCNGTRWVTAHYWSGYDGGDYYAAQQGEKTVCRIHDLQPWEENWGRAWRPSFACCLGVPKTQELAQVLVERLMDDGLDWIQFLDQNAACSTFPCFAPDHGHPAGPGKWMNGAMQSLLDSFRKIADNWAQASGGKRQFAFSVESPPNEFFMPNFQVCDQRIAPPGHRDYGSLFFPLYSFLYHEFIVIQGGFGVAPPPYHLEIRSAVNLIMGEIPGAILRGDGSLLNRCDSDAWWSPWDSSMGSQEDAIAMLRRTVALRRGKARDYLVFGRMLRPAQVDEIKIVHWEMNSQVYDIPSVFHSAWRSPKGGVGIVAANWTKDKQDLAISDSRLGAKFTESISAITVDSRRREIERGKIALSLPPLSCALLESECDA